MGSESRVSEGADNHPLPLFLSSWSPAVSLLPFLGSAQALAKARSGHESNRRPISWGNLISCFEESRCEGRDQCSHLGKIESAHIICLLTFLLVSPSASKVTCMCKKKKSVKFRFIHQSVSSPTSLSQLLSVERNTTAWRRFLCARHTYRQTGCSTPLTLSCSLLFLFVMWQAELRVNPQKPPDIKPWLSACGSALK